jgi:UDPglucose 6-dehydrogenase
MKIGFLGLGKLGLPCALAAESRGHEVIGCDISEEVCAAVRARKISYREEGAQEALSQSRLRLVSPGALAEEADIIFVAVQTPHEARFEGVSRLPDERADFDYRHLKAGVKTVADEIAARRDDKIVVVISTVLPGTIAREIAPLINPRVKLCYNPFFIAMGTTMRDFLHPEFVLLGVEDEAAANTVEAFYRTIHGAPVFKTTVASAELAKVAYNTFIGMKIVFANTMMEICHKTGANIDAISDAMALANKRLISAAYLRGGMGDGGGCHPRDNIALSWLAQKLDLRFDFFESLMIARERQTEWLADLMIAEARRRDLPLVILGKSFKPETAITTGSPARLLKNILDERGVTAQIYDPFVDGDAPAFAPSVFLIATKHPQFAAMNFPQGSVVIDPWRYIPDCAGAAVIRVGE